jgi:hypothetical protein
LKPTDLTLQSRGLFCRGRLLLFDRKNQASLASCRLLQDSIRIDQETSQVIATAGATKRQSTSRSVYYLETGQYDHAARLSTTRLNERQMAVSAAPQRSLMNRAVRDAGGHAARRSNIPPITHPPSLQPGAASTPPNRVASALKNIARAPMVRAAS